MKIRRTRSAYGSVEKAITENERRANRFIAIIEIIFLIGFIVVFIMNWFNKVWTYDNTDIFYLIMAGLMAIVAVPCLVMKGKGKHWKTVLITVGIIVCFFVAVYNVYGYWVCFVIPILAGARYYDRSFSLRVTVSTIIAAVGQQPLAAAYGKSIGYLDANALAYKMNNGVSIVLDNGVTNALIKGGYITDSMIVNYDIGQIANIIVILGVIGYTSISIAKNGKDSMVRVEELNTEKLNAELENESMKMKVAASQVNPHFLYNSLTAIMAIDGNPPETMNAISNFAKYLRENLDTLSYEGPISFEKELSHIEKYIWLEKLRFEDKVEVEFHIDDIEFELPPLTVQMLVENAIKHGLTSRPEGGRVIISTYHGEGYHIITVEDNGVGFNTESEITKEHVGLRSITNRIENMCDGIFEISSTIGKGTKATIRIPE